MLLLFYLVVYTLVLKKRVTPTSIITIITGMLRLESLAPCAFN